ncbi:MAG: GIY-YIG nuclease family protein [Cyanobacteria bacterium J06643_5]
MNVAEINPLTLPSLSLNERKQLPSCSAIYFVMQGDCVLYIGQTINLAQRWATHNRLKQFAKMVGDIRVAWLECSDTNLLRKVEAALIEQFEKRKKKENIGH